MALGKVDEAKRVLTMYSKLARKPINLESVNLVVEENPTKDDKMSTRARVSTLTNYCSYLIIVRIIEFINEWNYMFSKNWARKMKRLV